jgi:succinate dehydrogenase/fumarate reductase flavoprotein subunit
MSNSYDVVVAGAGIAGLAATGQYKSGARAPIRHHCSVALAQDLYLRRFLNVTSSIHAP